MALWPFKFIIIKLYLKFQADSPDILGGGGGGGYIVFIMCSPKTILKKVGCLVLKMEPNGPYTCFRICCLKMRFWCTMMEF